MKRYEEFTSRYTKLGKRVNDLSRIKALMHAVGDPQERLRFVHVAGTNGKGSICEMTARALTAAGYGTGLFTSPYILRYNDRMRINGEEITDRELDELADIVEPEAERLAELGFSQFEITQAMAMLWFERKGCDIVVLEVGLGGALDSTNVIPAPLVSVIGSLSLDHTAILGDTVAEIAAQKAGIIKPSSPAVLSRGNPAEAVNVVRARAEECGSELVIPDEAQPVSVTAFGSEFVYKGRKYAVSMGGAHQLINACTVIETLNVLRREGFEIPDAAVGEGLRAVIPARLQILSRKPLVIVDGGHNPQGVGALAAALGTLPCRKRAVIGMLSDKDSAEAARLIAGSASKFVCADGFAPNARPAEELAALLRECGADAVASELPPEKTVKLEFESLAEDEALVICGSLYLASLFAGGMQTIEQVHIEDRERRRYLLDKVGRVMIKNVRDRSLRYALRIADMTTANERDRERFAALAGLDGKQREAVCGLLSLAVTDTIYDFLEMFEENEELMKLVIKHGGKEYDMTSLSEKMGSEIACYDDAEGWIRRFSDIGRFVL